MLISLFGGFVVLLFGGELLVRGASAMASRLGVSPLVIGIAIVGFGTSAPELVTSVQAALAGSPGIAIGNIVGSNIANILLILGIGALIHPFASPKQGVLRDGGLVIITAVMLALAGLGGGLSRIAGCAFLAGLALYMWMLFTDQRRQTGTTGLTPGADDAQAKRKQYSLVASSFMTLFGIIGVVAGGKFLVDGAIDLAKALEVSEEVIGLTLVALGTSLPEMVTSIIAAIRRHTEIALGNVLGSNIYNVLGIAGTTAAIQPLQIPSHMMHIDMPLMVALSILMVVILIVWRGISRLLGGALLGGYGIYVTTLVA